MVKIKILLDNKKLLDCNVIIYFSGFEMSEKLNSKYEFEPSDKFNILISNKIKRIKESLNTFDYNNILRLMITRHWGNEVMQYSKEFENNVEYYLNPDSDETYADYFHQYMCDKVGGNLKGTIGTIGGIPVVAARDIYSKQT